MKPYAALLLTALYVLQTAAVFLLFDHMNSNVIIPYIPIIGLGTWIYGRRIGLLLIILSHIPSYLCFQLHADTYAYPIDRLAGTLIMLSAVVVIDRLRRQAAQIKALHQNLEDRVSIRGRELSWLTDELLQYSEKRRSEMGQRLHDGIGQQLTGIQLLCASLEEHLSAADAEESVFAKVLSKRAGLIHHQVRRIARSLFPVRIVHVGLRAALDEMTACLSELYAKSITVTELRELQHLPEALSLQIYRIFQESCTYLLELGQADALYLTLDTTRALYILGIEHDGKLSAPPENTLFRLIQYRLKKTEGEVRFTVSPRTGNPVFYFQIPKPADGLTP